MDRKQVELLAFSNANFFIYNSCGKLFPRESLEVTRQKSVVRPRQTKFFLKPAVRPGIY